jgi:hypothetical protein
MGKVRRRKPRRRRIGRVSIYLHHGRWWAYYREHGRPVRKAVAEDEDAAATIAAQINLELTATVAAGRLSQLAGKTALRRRRQF